MKKTALAFCLLVGLVLAGSARKPDLEEYRAIQDSLSGLPSNRLFYHEQKAGRCPRSTGLPDSVGLRLVGKWGAGPSWMVTGRDTLAYLSRGSEVVVVNIADPSHPWPLAFIQADRLTGRAVLEDSLLYVATSGGIEVYDVADPLHARRVIRYETPVSDLRVEDTLVYVIAADSFKVYSFADPASPWLVGACRDSGYVLGVANGVACVGERWGLYVIDARDPAHPYRAASWGADVQGVTSRGSLSYVTTGNPNQPRELNFSILNVADPGSPLRIGYLPGVGATECFLEDTLAFLSGYITENHEFRILSIADSTQPRVVSACSTHGNNDGVWANTARSVALVADWWWGLVSIDIHDIAQPVLDTTVLAASEASDIGVTGNWAFVAGGSNGLLVLDLTDPSTPSEVARLDTNLYDYPRTEAIAVGDSVACIDWTPGWHCRTVNINDPMHPVHLGECPDFEGDPTAIVLRDTLAYTAGRYRFQVVNVADPRNPERVGVAVLPGTVARNLALCDSMTYVANGSSGGLQCISIADVTTPRIVGSWPGRSSSVVGRDSVLYVVAPYTGCVSLSVADPTSPRVLDSLGLPGWYNSVVAVDTLLYVGGGEMVIVDAADPDSLEVLGTWIPPYLVEKVVYAEPYIFAACSQGGVCVLETTHVGMSEDRRTKSPGQHNIVLKPNPARGKVELGLRGLGVGVVSLVDAAGRRAIPDVKVEPGAETIVLRLTGLRAGVYFVEAEGSDGVREVAKLLKN